MDGEFVFESNESVALTEAEIIQRVKQTIQSLNPDAGPITNFTFIAIAKKDGVASGAGNWDKPALVKIMESHRGLMEHFYPALKHLSAYFKAR